MSTSGAYGFRMNETDKLALARTDAGHKDLGKVIMDYIANTPLAQMRETASRLTIDPLGKDPQYPFEFLFDGSFDKIVDASFMLNESNCNHAYILNLDSSDLELYAGATIRGMTNTEGRYASNGGVQLIHTIPLPVIRLESINYLTSVMSMAYQSNHYMLSLKEEIEKRKALESNSK